MNAHPLAINRPPVKGFRAPERINKDPTDTATPKDANIHG